ncbi:NAD(P)H dehydrogenase, quinone family [Sandaracinus amylolyticus]|uniref:NAD(P)H dehydrogenase, quinone family n=2 Tax=Sandaracinus amylolyticus TaxID=927083 RepID=A0A0F6SHT3_9BACT|nr:NAD(P)H dehydrogenase, quinone family [Sandaracinus amylolyticus]
MALMTDVLVLLGHAEPNSFNGALADAYLRGAERAGARTERIDLASLELDLVLRAGHREEQPLEPDLVRLQRAIERARHVVWVFPTYWASPPAVVRGVIDRLFLPGWAFRYEGSALPKGLLAGRSSRVITTMDSPSWWYALAHHRALHATMGTATLTFCGFAPVRFTTLYAVREMDAARRAAWIARVDAIGARDASAIARPMLAA